MEFIFTGCGGHERASTMLRSAASTSSRTHLEELGPTCTGLGYRPCRIPRYSVDALMLPNFRHTSDLLNSSTLVDIVRLLPPTEERLYRIERVEKARDRSP